MTTRPRYTDPDQEHPMERSIRALICRTVHDDPDRRWVAHIADTLDQDPGQNTGRIAQRRDDGTGRREYAPTWEAALAAARAHLAPEEQAACGYCHHPGAEPCEEPSTGPELCTRAEGHEPPHVACSDHQHGQVMWETTVETIIDPAPAVQRFAAALGRASRPLNPGRTGEERYLEQALDAALARVRDLEQQQHTSLEVAEELAGHLEKVEQERDRLTTTLATTARQRDEADKRNARPLTAAAIESVLHDVLPLTTEHLKADDIAGIASDLHLALTDPTRPIKPTNAMVERGMAHIEEKPWTVRSLLTAALTEEDPR